MGIEHKCILRTTGRQTGIKKMSVFQDFNEDYRQILNSDPYVRSTLTNDMKTQRALEAATAYAGTSLFFQEIYLSFVIDARHFFNARQKDWTWCFLRTLVLTSECLTPSGSTEDISNLLYHGAKAPIKMPQLLDMTLWNGMRGEACAFAYSRAESCLHWRSTWDLHMEPHVVEAWEDVLAITERSTIRIHKEIIESLAIQSHGDAIHYLKLPKGVVDPVSLKQIRREAKPAAWLTRDDQ